MAKAFWKGAISFGLVTIPVKMYVATVSRSLGFHHLHKKCLTRTKQVLYCERDDEYLTPGETVLGYEYAKGQFAIIKEDDLEKVPVKTNHTIDIVGFVKRAEIDPIYYNSSYYLEPEDLGVKPFLLLRQVLAEGEHAALAKISFARHEHLSLVRPFEETMVLHTLHYHNEIRPWGEMNILETALHPEEKEMAALLVSSMVKPFRPREYRDAYREALEKMIEGKIQGREVASVPMPSAVISDLMTALKASIAAAQPQVVNKTARK